MADAEEPISKDNTAASAAQPAGDATRIVPARPSGQEEPATTAATVRPSLTAAKAVPADTGTLKPGQLLAYTYEIELLLARGGMGEVYRARHTELGSIHAIKVIRPELADSPDIITLFTEEARKLRMVRNDAVVAYDGMFRDESGLRYLVMEFVDGISLAKLMRERNLTPGEVRQLRDRVAQGLAAAHDRSIYHRDISPDNIILVDGRVELAKIVDFGIAKAAGAERTVIGSGFAGKYSYVSPEQLGLYGGQVDGRSDIYSLGLVLVAALLGHQVPMGDTPVSAIEARRTVPDLSAVPADLREELSPMLEPDPAHRPPSVRELPGSMIAATAVALGTIARTPPPPPPQPTATHGRSKVLPLALGALVVVILAGGAGAYYVLRPSPSASPAAIVANNVPSSPTLPPAPAPSLPAAPAPAPPAAPVEAQPAPAPTPQPAAPAPQVAVATPPPAPTVDRNAITTRVTALTRQFDCAELKTTLTDDFVVKVNGFVGSAADAAKLKQELAGVPNVTRVDDSVNAYQWPHCEVLKLLQDTGASADPADAPKLVFNVPSLTYRDGDRLVIRATANATADGFLIVDYYDTSGKVVHLLPRPQHPGNAVKAGEVVTLGTDKANPGKDDAVYEVGEPYGPNLIVAVFSRQQLIRDHRPEIEDAKAYLALLGRGLDKTPSGQGGHPLGTYTFINTVPR